MTFQQDHRRQELDEIDKREGYAYLLSVTLISIVILAGAIYAFFRWLL